MPLRVISVNIEGDRHLSRVIPFLQAEKPDVICLQEVFGADIARFEQELHMQSHFVAMTSMELPTKYGFSLRGQMGVALLSSLPLASIREDVYRGSAAEVPVFREPNSPRRVLLSAEVEKSGEHFTLATTHFTWSPGGQTTDEQLKDAGRLIELGKTFDSLFVCGDFNAPRGGGVYEKLVAAGWHDWVPTDVTTTLDPNLHYAGKLDLVVDYFFSVGDTSGLKTSATKVVSGVSDHQALMGEVERI